MELSDLSFFVSVIGVLIAAIALWRSRTVEEANSRYREIQEKLAGLELASLTQKTNIEVSIHSGRVRVRNVGNLEARNVQLTFQPLDNKSLPAGLDAIKPRTVLAPSADFEVGYARATGASSHMLGEWRWVNPDATESVQQNEFRL